MRGGLQGTAPLPTGSLASRLPNNVGLGLVLTEKFPLPFDAAQNEREQKTSMQEFPFMLNPVEACLLLFQ
jgi:hypothetical protein